MSDALLADRYKLVRLIGEGGYGTVWLARDEQLRRDVAIKKLSVRDRSAPESQKKADRFRHEAITMAKIDHANVVTIYDVGSLAATEEIFLVMELLDGRSLLEELVTRGALAPQRALDRFIEALEGLQAAHDVGAVHKDLKPANLFLHRVDTNREQMKLIDFGIARMDSLTKLTGTGRMAGSPRYLAPEYILGESVTPAIDIYQVALILVEALTGDACIPRGLKYFEICERHILSQLEIPESLRNGPLGPVLDRALQRQPQDRFRSADEFADALRKIRPEELPTSDADATTVKMKALQLDSVEIPSSEVTVSGMIDKLREEEAALRPNTRRYSEIVEPQPDPGEHADTVRIDRSGPQPAPPLGNSGPQPVANQTVAPLTSSGPHPLPDWNTFPEFSTAQHREELPSRTQLRLMAAGALAVATVVIAGSLLIRRGEREPVVDQSLPPSPTTCMLQCTQWYQDREVRGACQDLCRGTRPPTAPPFPLRDDVEPQFSEEVVEAPGTEPAGVEDAREPEPANPAADSEPSESDTRAGEKSAAKPTLKRLTPSKKRAPAEESNGPLKFKPAPQKW